MDLDLLLVDQAIYNLDQLQAFQLLVNDLWLIHNYITRVRHDANQAKAIHI